MKKAFLLSGIASAVLLLFTGFSARAVDIDLSGKVFKPGGNVIVTSTSAVPSSLVYEVNISGSGTSTGSFVPLIADGDFATAVAAIDPYAATGLLQMYLADLSGKFPASLGAQEGFNEVNNAPIATGTTGTLITEGHVSLSINKHGIVTAKLTGMSFIETNNSGKRVRFSGTYALSSGDLSVIPLPATSGTAQPGIIALLNTHFCLAGSAAYETTYPGNNSQVSLRPGGSESLFFIMQNNGPATDNYVLQADPFPTDVSAVFYNGKTNITSQVTGSGYPINNFPSGGLQAIKVKIIISRHALKYDNGVLTFRLFRSVDSTALAYGGVQFYVR